MSHPIDGVRLKIGRSFEHYNALSEEIDAFVQRQPHEPIARFDAEQGVQIFRLKAREEIPVRISVLVGDCVHQLRSALDHLAWQLALLTTPTPPTSTEFPIFKDADVYTRKRKDKIGALPADAQRIVDGLQPHLAPQPERNLLWVLHRVNAVDKHQTLHIVSTLPTGIGVHRPEGVDLEIESRFGAFDDETDLARMTIKPPHDPEMAVPVTFQIALSFAREGPGVGLPVRKAIYKMGMEVESVTDKLAALFP